MINPNTAIITNLIPPRWLDKIGHNGDKIQRAWAIRFYYSSGEDTIVICKDSETCFSIYTPRASHVPSDKIKEIIDTQRSDIDDQIKKFNIPARQQFLYDTKRKIIIRRDSFIDHVPAWNPKSMLFVLDMKDGHPDEFIYEILDQTNESILATVSMMMAKQYLVKPKMGDWSPEGKLLLNFLVSREYKISVDLSETQGAWKQTDMNFDGNEPRKTSIQLDKMKLTKTMAMSRKLFKNDIPMLSPGTINKKTVNSIMMSDLIGVGVSAFFNRGYGLIEVELDQCRDIFDKVIIDSASKICYVVAKKGTTANLNYFKDVLQTDNVVINDLDNLSLIKSLSEEDNYSDMFDMFS